MKSSKDAAAMGKAVLSDLYDVNLDSLPEALSRAHLASSQPDRNLALANHLYGRIVSKIKMHHDAGKTVDIYGPEWSRQKANVQKAAEAHARIIIDTYGPNYAFPNKYPDQNAKVIEAGAVDLYFLVIDGEFVGTTCLCDQGEMRAELGRSAAIRPRVGNTIIQDLSILEWLLNDRVSDKYHTLFTTLRTAPDQDIGLEQPMRGGQAITSQWQKFPELFVNGTAPLYSLYCKHGSLEQFTIAQITRAEFQTVPLFIADETDRLFVRRWHAFYGLDEPPAGNVAEAPLVEARVQVHAPPDHSSIFKFVYAAMTFGDGAIDEHGESIETYFTKEVPFIQAAVPIGDNSIDVQRQLRDAGFQAFGYEPANNFRPAHLFFGKVRPGNKVVPTNWTVESEAHPYWTGELANHAARIEKAWQSM
ncbi:MAG: hypothetical protein QF511_00265 [Rhodospirillales bacterium]|jgi:hypothetical protein|nr:hypothetical protein [Rhodospirillales bacterium]MDP7216182.1 hypothetical protein [Rhodospirillales bacterium]HIJ42444.1 hypothetical protein [Rhodospirillaceae bacterium]HIJ91978.1 hypothetical protein [Rhodospirillaceae bacterium]HJP54630.1 hypothetical protein [Rhodospirillales bacterium]